jgi:hypothetical protein
MTGHVPPLGDGPPPPFQSGGFIARDCTDLAAAHAALTGAAVPPAKAARLHLGQITGADLPLCPRTAQALCRALDWLAAAGHHSAAASLDFPAAWQAYGTLLMAASAPHLRAWQRPALRLLALAARGRPLRRAMLRGLAGKPAAPAVAGARRDHCQHRPPSRTFRCAGLPGHCRDGVRASAAARAIRWQRAAFPPGRIACPTRRPALASPRPSRFRAIPWLSCRSI